MKKLNLTTFFFCCAMLVNAQAKSQPIRQRLSDDQFVFFLNFNYLNVVSLIPQSSIVENNLQDYEDARLDAGKYEIMYPKEKVIDRFSIDKNGFLDGITTITRTSPKTRVVINYKNGVIVKSISKENNVLYSETELKDSIQTIKQYDKNAKLSMQMTINYRIRDERERCKIIRYKDGQEVSLSAIQCDSLNDAMTDIIPIRSWLDANTLNNAPRNKQNKNDSKPLIYAEQMPVYNGGEAEMAKYIYKNLVYPVGPDYEIVGRVILKFVVEKDGSLSHIEVKRSLNPDLDNEAIRMVKSMPKWIPGKQNGEVVPVIFFLPITFSLEN